MEPQFQAQPLAKTYMLSKWMLVVEDIKGEIMAVVKVKVKSVCARCVCGSAQSLSPV